MRINSLRVLRHVDRLRKWIIVPKTVGRREIKLHVYFKNNFAVPRPFPKRNIDTHQLQVSIIYYVPPNLARLFSKENCTLLLKCNLSVGE